MIFGNPLLAHTDMHLSGGRRAPRPKCARLPGRLRMRKWAPIIQAGGTDDSPPIGLLRPRKPKLDQGGGALALEQHTTCVETHNGHLMRVSEWVRGRAPNTRTDFVNVLHQWLSAMAIIGGGAVVGLGHLPARLFSRQWQSHNARLGWLLQQRHLARIHILASGSYRGAPTAAFPTAPHQSRRTSAAQRVLMFIGLMMAKLLFCGAWGRRLRLLAGGHRREWPACHSPADYNSNRFQWIGPVCGWNYMPLSTSING